MPRSIWTGSISFGLVSIPVKVYSAVRAHDVRFHQVTKDGSRIHVERVSDKTGRRVDYGDLKKGYETSKGKWVVFEPDELAEIEDFVPLTDIDPVYFERTYHLAPDGEAAARAYALLATVMDERQRVGIGKVVMREKQYLAAIRPYGKGLAMSTMLFADEVVEQSDIDAIPSRRPSLKPQEKRMAVQIVDSLATDWKPSRYHDDYEEQLRSLIRAKARGKTIERADEDTQPAKVLDLVQALEASLEKRRPPRRRTGTKRKSTKSTKSTATSRPRRRRTA
jgi:DNA end-binding protein Ku